MTPLEALQLDSLARLNIPNISSVDDVSQFHRVFKVGILFCTYYDYCYKTTYNKLLAQQFQFL